MDLSVSIPDSKVPDEAQFIWKGDVDSYSANFAIYLLDNRNDTHTILVFIEHYTEHYPSVGRLFITYKTSDINEMLESKMLTTQVFNQYLEEEVSARNYYGFTIH